MIQIRRADICPDCLKPLEHEDLDLGEGRLQITLFCKADERSVYTRTVTRDQNKDRRSP